MRGWHGEPHRHSLAAHGVPTSMRARAIYTHDLPLPIQKLRYRFRNDEFIDEIKKKHEYINEPTPFATWLVKNTDEDVFYDWYPYLWFDVFYDDDINVLMPVYDSLSNYMILGFIGEKKDILKLLRKILEENPGDYEASMAYYHISNSYATDNREIFYTLHEAQIIIERCRQEYNTFRPHSPLGYLPPAPEAVLRPRGMAMEHWVLRKELDRQIIQRLTWSLVSLVGAGQSEKHLKVPSLVAACHEVMLRQKRE